jgi:thioredoxin-like negative regulator of GroEL
MLILKFHATWCAPCHQLSKTLAQFNLPVREVDVDLEPELAEKFNIKSVPTLVLLRDDIESARLQGASTYAQIAKFIL